MNDVVAYELMRESATTLTALLLRSIDTDPRMADAAGAEIARLRQEVLAVNGYDRAGVAALASRISNRIAVLSGDSA